jgi:membrane protein DedA with SNARE-associated domain
MSIKSLLKTISIPLILLAVYLLMYIVWSALNLPRDEEMLVIVKSWFSEYGLWIVFIGALIEGFLLLGQYFPGGFIIFLGVISAGKDFERATLVVSVVCLSFFIAYSLNYIVGRYGWYNVFEKFGLKDSLEKSKDKLVKQGLNAIFFSYWEPNFASIVATAAGVLKVPFKQFTLYSVIGIILWNIFWGTLVYSLGEAALQITGMKWVLIIFGTWILVLLVKGYVGERNS